MSLLDRGLLWWINEAGICMEIIGAIVIVVASFRSRAQIKNIQDTFDAELPAKLRDVIANQAFTELAGFALLALGLLGQLIGGFQ